ncbi:MAG: thiamine pyrophosphate-binding protein, partial [Pseudomonadota bacterium]
VPMIVLTGAVDPDEALTYTHQVLDHQAVFRPITKATFQLTPGGAGLIAEKAVAVATEPRQGPVHIDVPISVADAPSAPHPARRPAAVPAVPCGTTLSTLVSWISEAERPVAIVGLDVLQEGSEADVGAFLEKHQIPFITTYKAKGFLPEIHPLCLGAAGLSPLADTRLVPFVRDADLVLSLGYDPIEMRVGWRDPWDPAQQRVVDIAAVPNRHYMHQATLNHVGHVGATAAAIGEMATPRARWISGAATELNARLKADFPHDDDWGPAAVIAEARAVLPDTTLATADSGAHRILLSQMWDCYAPRQLIQSSALCTMGCAVPMAIGEALVAPERPVISFSGDAGLLMVAGELSTALELGVKPIFLVFVDASLALIELKQRQRHMTNRGVEFDRHDYAAIGRAFGGQGATVRSRPELRAALESALAADTFTVIAAEIDRESYDGKF